MQPIPYYDRALKDGTATRHDLNILVGFTYFFCLLYVCQFMLAVYNIQAFIIGQRRYKTPPLLVFYIMVLLLTVTRFYFTLWCLPQFIERILFAAEMMPILKVNLGLIQCWILAELYMRIKFSSKLSDLRNTGALKQSVS